MPGRQYSAGSGYRYGFNGKEKDNEVKGEGNQQDYGLRMYDPRLGRFLSVDPLTKGYPELTPYQFASNSPIAGVDLDGGEFKFSIFGAQTISTNMLATSMSDARERAKQGKNPALGFVTGPLKHFAAGAAAGGIAYDWMTGGNVTRTTLQVLAYSQIASMFEDNRAKTPEGRAEQDKRGRDAAAQAVILELSGWAGGNILRAGSRAVAKYMSGTFTIGPKTYAAVTEHLKQFGDAAENEVMLARMQKIANKEMKATEIDINFAKHELREAELMKAGKTYEEAHHAVLKEQGMGGMNVSEYQKKLYTKEAIDAGDAQLEKEIMKK